MIELHAMCGFGSAFITKVTRLYDADYKQRGFGDVGPCTCIIAMHNHVFVVVYIRERLRR